MDIMKIIPETGMSKKVISDGANDIIRRIEEGELDPIKALIAFKSMELLSEEVVSFIRKRSEAEAEKYKGIPVYGATLSVRATPAVYDMEADIEYVNLKKKFKEREDYLKEAIKSKSGRVITEDGEVVEAPPMVKPRGSTIAVSFKKE